MRPVARLSSLAMVLGVLLRMGADPSIAATASTMAPNAGDVVLDQFVYDSGETTPHLRLHYRTLGTPRRGAQGRIANAVLLLHGTTGTAETFLRPDFAGVLFGAGQPLDLAHNYLVIPDGIGAGGSSKPSDGLRTRFPHYGYRDQVRAQMDLLKAIGVEHLKLVLGTSMGGMQTWLWGEMYPDAMDALVAIASTPAPVSGRNIMWRQMIMQAIRNDPGFDGGNYLASRPPTLWRQTLFPLFAIMTSTADRLQKAAPTRQDGIALVEAEDNDPRKLDPTDALYLFASSFDYDPQPKLADLIRPMLSINFADDLLNPPELLQLPKTENISAVMLPAGPASMGHQSLAHPSLWVQPLKAFLDKQHFNREP